ncbi:lamin tail domain-containing protein [Streptomyces sp. NPDC088354]|uniref:lamin tail domain-containing protein n=1 Tax=unclassified Streptomyces TaxID=2593676 RepID=UPI0029B44CBF|nr:lamin tail domain-containing protein [Streptomyces sp. MI02-7b]MDX3072927.1 lamin tail domain-containing protein [Streptomyces sp. MI02-7b]
MSASFNARRVIATVLASGAVVAAAAMPASADNGHGRGHGHGPAPRSAVSIGDVRHDEGGRGVRSNRALNTEWVEVVNRGRDAVNLRGWTLSDSDGNRYRFTFLRLPGHSKVRVHTGQGRDSRFDVFQDRRKGVWDKRDSATLRNDHGRVVDTESWGGRHYR